jgi:small conductance mechanosensitive channel
MIDFQGIINWFSRTIPLTTIPISTVVYAIITIFIGYIISIYVSKHYQRTLKGKIEDLVLGFTVKILQILIMIISIFIAIGYFGFDIAVPLLGTSAVTGLIFGFAFQSTLSNLASGFMIAFVKPFRIGDLVEIAERRGTVQEVSTVVTTLKDDNGYLIIVPNSKVWDKPITNYSYAMKGGKSK